MINFHIYRFGCRSIFHYDDVTISQVVSDLEAIDGKDLPESLPGIYTTIVLFSSLCMHSLSLSLSLSLSPSLSTIEGKLKGVKLEFSLPSSSYATMVIRELTHVDTSSAYQSTLNPLN